MEKLQQFAVEVGWLWLVGLAIIVIASVIHYIITRRELNELKVEIKARGLRYQPGSAKRSAT